MENAYVDQRSSLLKFLMNYGRKKRLSRKLGWFGVWVLVVFFGGGCAPAPSFFCVIGH